LAADGSSYVTHWIVVRKTLMAGFLDALRSTSHNLSWVDNILDHIPHDDIIQGFSEYASYVSWVKQQHPSTQHIMQKKTWLRNPVGGASGVRLAAAQRPDGLCCPSSWQHELQRWLAYDYYGFEVGHHDFCAWDKHPHSYGLASPRA
jgi:hypothetical protein